MKRYIVLLRGINVGGKNSLPMQGLRSLLQSDGFSGVKSYIQSGNVLLGYPQDPAARVAELIAREYGYDIPVLAIAVEDFVAMVAQHPYPAADPKQVHCFFCFDPPRPEEDKINALAVNNEQWQQPGQVVFLHTPRGMGRSALGAKLERCLGVATTARHLNTLNKLVALTQAD